MAFFYLSVESPKIIQQPKSRSVPTGAQTTFTVEATGDDLIFQWQKNGSDVHNDSIYSGTDTNTLSIRHVNKSDGGHYRCLVKNEVKREEEVSEEAKLTVGEGVLQCLACAVVYPKAMKCILNTKANLLIQKPLYLVDPPKVIQHPKSQSVPTRGETTFTVEATGDDLTFKWQKNSHNLKCGGNYSGTDTNTLKIRQVKKTDAGCYRCLVKNEVKSEGEISEEAELDVCECLNM